MVTLVVYPLHFHMHLKSHYLAMLVHTNKIGVVGFIITEIFNQVIMQVVAVRALAAEGKDLR